MKRSINDKMLNAFGRPPKRIVYGDAICQNLLVVIQPTGKIKWLWNGRIDGQTRQVRLGMYPALSVAEARRVAADFTNKRDQAQLQKKFPDPFAALTISPPLPEPIAVAPLSGPIEMPQPVAEPITPVSENMNWLWDEYMKREGAAKASGKEKQRCWDKDLKPHIGHIPYVDVAYDDLADIIADVAEDRPSHANHLVSYIKRCFRWAVTKGRPFTKLTVDPAADLTKPTDYTVKDRALDEQEIIWFFKAADASDDSDGFITALLMLLYNGVRRSEVFQMPWDEYTESSGQWLIPSKRTKNGDPLLLPLASTSKALLKARKEVSGNSKWVFPASRGEGPLAGYNKRLEAFRVKMREIATKDNPVAVIEPWSMHDLRRTLSTGMNGLTTPEGDPMIPGEIVERVINHRLAKMAGTYNVHDYKAEKKRALELWDARLTELRARARKA